ncbi:hypothetical protein JOE11_005187 [Robbsia andropogonis]|uniref:hypothetical protein n=1 Tax=Robbsia andropogonis TaxID=28092 RepID=UPI003D1C7053
MALLRGDGQDKLRQLIAEATPAEMLWHVGSDHWLDIALGRLWHQYTELLEQIDLAAQQATEKAKSDFSNWKDRLTELNPGASETEIVKEAKLISQVGKKPYDRVAGSFSGRLLPIYVEVTSISAALCEAEINLALEWGCAIINKPELFDLIESQSTINKWIDGPKLVLDHYQLPPGCGADETLRKLFAERNRLMHSKASVRVGGLKNSRAQKPKTMPFSEALFWMSRYFSLPFDLCDFLRDCHPIKGGRFPINPHRGDIGRSRQSRLTCPASIE